MSYSLEAISLPRVYELAIALDRAVNEKEDNSSTAFKRQVLDVLRSHKVDCSSVTVIGTDGLKPTTDYVLRILLTEVYWNVALVLSDWLDRYLATGYDYVAAWAEVQSFQGC